MSGLDPAVAPSDEWLARGIVQGEEGWRLSQDPRTFGVAGAPFDSLVASARSRVILARGERDPMVSTADLRAHSAQAVEIAGTGHNVQVEKPDAIVDLLQSRWVTSEDEQRALAGAFDPNKLDPTFYENPYPLYAALRRFDPVHRCPDGTYFLSRYADLDRIYRDRTAFSSDKKQAFAPKFGVGSPLYEHHTTSLVFNDAPYHTRVRRQIVGALDASRAQGDGARRGDAGRLDCSIACRRSARSI